MSAEAAFVSAYAMLVAMKIVCFILGYLTVRLGYQLIKQGVMGEFKFSASFGGTKADLASVSPGLLFVLLGVGLVGFAMYVDKTIEIERSSSKDIVDIQPTEPLAGNLPARGKLPARQD